MPNRFFLIATIAALILPCGTRAESQRPPADVVTDRTSSPGAADIERFVSKGKLIEILRGQAALGHLGKLKATKPRAFEDAGRRLRKLGMTPTEIVVVQRSTSLIAKRPSGNAKYALAQTSSDSSPDGELVTWSWDDGNAATWEGEVYIAAYGDQGAESLSNAQIDISTPSTVSALWETVVYAERNRDGIPEPIPTGSLSTPRSAPFSRAVSKDRSVMAEMFGAGPYRSAGLWNSIPPPVRGWMKCAAMACTAAAAACWIAGPGWVVCFNSWCTGGSLACAVGALLEYAGG